MAKWAAVGLASLCALFWLLFYTPALTTILWLNTLTPGQQRDMGITTGDVSGSLAEGFEIEFLKYKKRDRRLNLKDLVIQYSNPFNLYFEKRLDVREFSIGSLHWSMPAGLNFLEDRPSIPLTPDPGAPEPPSAPPFLKSYQARMETLSLNDFLLEIPKLGLSIAFEKFFLKEVEIQNGRLSFGSGKLNSPALYLETTPPGIQRGPWPEHFHGHLRKDYFQGLKADVPVWGSLSLENGEIQFHLEAFEGTAILETEPDGVVHFQLKQFEPNRFVNQPTPLGPLNIDLVLGHAWRIDKKYYNLRKGQITFQEKSYTLQPTLFIMPGPVEPGGRQFYDFILKGNAPSEEIQLQFRFITDSGNPEGPVAFQVQPTSPRLG